MDPELVVLHSSHIPGPLALALASVVPFLGPLAVPSMDPVEAYVLEYPDHRTLEADCRNWNNPCILGAALIRLGSQIDAGVPADSVAEHGEGQMQAGQCPCHHIVHIHKRHPGSALKDPRNGIGHVHGAFDLNTQEPDTQMSQEGKGDDPVVGSLE